MIPLGLNLEIANYCITQWLESPLKNVGVHEEKYPNKNELL
jgi:hypothetical protein